MDRPRLFIGSSSEGLGVARALQVGLDESFEVEIWSQGAFGLSQGNLDALINAGQDFDFAVLVLTPDDIVTANSIASPSPRDNVILEVGFFLGALGRERTFMVYDRTADLKIPSDLAGVSFATYTPPKHGNLVAAVGPACAKIITAAENAPAPKVIPSPRTPPDEWTQALVQSALELVCGALTTPLSPDGARLRAFIFKMEESQEGSHLVCSHFWAPRQVKEVVGELRFSVDPETAKEVAVVRAVLEKRVVAVPVSPLSEDLDGIQGEVEEDLCFVLAAPILGPGGEVWGTVDFDASRPEGGELLSQEMSHNVLFKLGKHLYLALSG